MPASATVDADWTNTWRLVNDFFARIAIAISAPSSNHDGGCSLNLTPDRRFYDGDVTRAACVRAHMPSFRDAIASSCRYRPSCTARLESGHRRLAHRADCDGGGQASFAPRDAAAARGGGRHGWRERWS